MSSTPTISVQQLAIGLRIFVDTDRLVDGLPKLTTVYAVTSSSYVNKYYILLGTEAGPSVWYAADIIKGAEKLDWKKCDGFVKLTQADPLFINELVKHFTSRLEEGHALKRFCSKELF